MSENYIHNFSSRKTFSFFGGRCRLCGKFDVSKKCHECFRVYNEKRADSSHRHIGCRSEAYHGEAFSRIAQTNILSHCIMNRASAEVMTSKRTEVITTTWVIDYCRIEIGASVPERLQVPPQSINDPRFVTARECEWRAFVVVMKNCDSLFIHLLKGKNS